MWDDPLIQLAGIAVGTVGIIFTAYIMWSDNVIKWVIRAFIFLICAFLYWHFS